MPLAADLRRSHGLDRTAAGAGGKLVGFALVLALHAVIIYALVTGLAHRVIEVVRKPIEAKIIETVRHEPPPPPPPPPQFTPPTVAVLPPPEIRIEPPKPPPPREPPPRAVTKPKPPPPSPPAPAVVAPPPPVAEPVRVPPHLDASHSHEPEYPPEARRLGQQGSVILQALIDVDGRVLETKLVQSSGVPRLDEAALAGIKSNYRFAPGTVDGKPQQMWYTFKFTWKLRS